MKMYNPAHPGLILREYIEGYNVTEVAKRLGVTRVTLSRILNGKAAISPEMALRLSQLLKTSPELWLGLQSQYDLWQLEQRPSFNIQPLFA
ncbi:HigA family addiction module antitoxin [Glaesserella parasuis]|uniref:Plasmid maintenance system antidote protein, XRE family/addiction module antidote protein, HigA family/PSEEN1946 proteic killer active protein n=5 Tax=Glaesserella parasuis TaxID=738 RepID=B8F404_GLAP5|nr:HigA family addiction module antitoxin [Glaesserella parasuis]AGO16138.1 plasmid maintenance system antidote protein, XRE family/addiction module antidote protein, HigA family/proteic killer active protein [Glaesserella parasuis ZJ0906]EQA03519.1 addiction module antidote protein, HigA family [Glaesserella parasuis MN-H]ACL32056.1 plasmid maintenance system antidote protein, XRE family/addiction module antidote protein, HigA family/PSEEN1946 proteic killer active protein [Glaesserella parasui